MAYAPVVSTAVQQSLTVRRAVLLALALALTGSGGCGDKKKTPDTADDVPAAKPVPSGPAVSVTLDGDEVVKLSAADMKEKIPLSEAVKLPPADKWRMVMASDGKGRRMFVRDPTRTYGQHRIHLYLDRKGELSIGVFRNPRPTPPPKQLAGILESPVVYLSGIREIEVRTKKAKRAKAPQPTLELRVSGRGAVMVTAQELDFIPRIKAADRREGSRGWNVAAILRATVPDAFVAGAPAIRLSAGGETLDIPGAALDDPGQLLFVKINRRGLFRFRHWRLGGERPKVLGELRGVTVIEVRPK